MSSKNFSEQVKKRLEKLSDFCIESIERMFSKMILDYDYGSYKGYFAENFVVEELISNRIDDVLSWQESKAEIEFLIELDGKIISLKVKSESITKAKSLKIFAEMYHPLYQVIFSARSIDYKNKIHYFPLYLAERLKVF